MNLQARVRRRLQLHRPHPLGGLPGLPPGDALLDYLGARPPPAPAAPWPGLREAAQALLHSGEPLRLGLRAGDLVERISWFLRLLELWPADERDDWLRAQLKAAQGHPLAGSPLHEALDARLFDPLLPTGLRLRLQALWLAVIAPGAVSLDAARRERELGQALALLDGWLRRG